LLLKIVNLRMSQLPNLAFRTKPKQLNNSGSGRVNLLVLLLIFLAVFSLIAFNRQNIFDWWKLRGYQPSTAVAGIADQDTMTPYARKIFYVNHPIINDKTTFVKVCPNNGGEQTIVLGCYHSNQAGINLLNVTDTRLNGVEQVTAAHEMLHAAYDRLSSSEKKNVDNLLTNYYENGLKDPRILATIAAYKKSEPKDVVNEMHSVFGTEVANLPPTLEQYYAKYFTNRQAVIALAGAYESEFTSRQATVSADDTKLVSLKSQIDALEEDLKNRQSVISSKQQDLNNLRNSGDFAAYNAAVNPYNALIDAYNYEITRVQGLVDQYNSLLEARNAVALEENQLVNDLNASNLSPINK